MWLCGCVAVRLCGAVLCRDLSGVVRSGLVGCKDFRRAWFGRVFEIVLAAVDPQPTADVVMRKWRSLLGGYIP